MSYSPSSVPLPRSFCNLLDLHSAVERALLVHLATQGASSPCSSAPCKDDQDTIVHSFPNLLSYASLKPMVERPSGLTLDSERLHSLAALWTMEHPLGLYLDTANMSIGITIRIKQNPTKPSLEIVGPCSPKSPPKRTKTTTMNVFALWSQGTDLRKQEVRKRLGQMVLSEYEKHTKSLPPSPPPTTHKRSNKRSVDNQTNSPSKDTNRLLATGFDFDNIPLPKLQEKKNSSNNNSSNKLSANEKSIIAKTIDKDNHPDDVFGSSPLPTTPRKSKFVIPQTPTTPPRKSSLLDPASPTPREKSSLKRTLSLTERIKLKEEAAKKAKVDSNVTPEKAGKTPNDLRKKSMLSRLASVADGVYMLFSQNAAGAGCPPSPSASLRTPPTRHRRAIPLDEVCAIVSKSSKISMSHGEAKDAVKLLGDLCMNFVHVKNIDGKEWLVLAVPAMALSEVKHAIRQELTGSSQIVI